MRNLIVTALAVAFAAWYAGHRSRRLARANARQAVERWEDEGGAVRQPSD
jgi:hypothetical protein